MTPAWRYPAKRSASTEPGIGFHGDFYVISKRDALFDACQQFMYGFTAEQAGGAATDEDGIKHATLDILEVVVQVIQQMTHIGGLWDRLFQSMRVEITIGAFLNAPGNMDIKPQRWQLQD